MIIDCHSHIGYENEYEHQNPEELIQKMNEAGIDKSIIFPFAPHTKKGSTYDDNEKISKICESNSKFIGFGRINQLDPNALEEVDHIIKLKLKGVKFHTSHCNITKAKKILKKLDEHKLPLIIHTSHQKCTSPINLRKIKYSGPIIIAHAGKDHFKEAINLANEFENIYIDISIVSLGKVQYIIKNTNPEKILFGSDSPYSHPKIDILKIKYATDDKTIRDQIFSKNIKKILNI
ncbi:amidohydrolase family protein [archaeon]|jgi:uncharacterized protein|nr:amidohydrolase family protein [archaeon]MBT3730634.1 amidohydrolase family protein [archaeon]MBT4669536.1 amidohydrolase family protein [archaeon]MBT5030293.1 amidohydrolase family protein [archaeon]MBT5288414.1 amidohydrolase family protein [archaeon]